MAETVVKIDNLVKRYKELIALDHFDLEIKKGEVFSSRRRHTRWATSRYSVKKCLL